MSDDGFNVQIPCHSYQLCWFSKYSTRMSYITAMDVKYICGGICCWQPVSTHGFCSFTVMSGCSGRVKNCRRPQSFFSPLTLVHQVLNLLYFNCMPYSLMDNKSFVSFGKEHSNGYLPDFIAVTNSIVISLCHLTFSFSNLCSSSN